MQYTFIFRKFYDYIYDYLYCIVTLDKHIGNEALNFIIVLTIKHFFKIKYYLLNYISRYTYISYRLFQCLLSPGNVVRCQHFDRKLRHSYPGYSVVLKRPQQVTTFVSSLQCCVKEATASYDIRILATVLC